MARLTNRNIKTMPITRRCQIGPLPSLPNSIREIEKIATPCKSQLAQPNLEPIWLSRAVELAGR